MTVPVKVDARFRALVPDEIRVPLEHTDAVAVVSLVVEDDPVRVTAPGLDELKVALAIGSADLVRSYCQMWTRFLTLAVSGVRVDNGADLAAEPRGTTEELRIDLATALIRIGAAEDEAVLFEWHPCVDTPACRAAADPKAPCACSGIPYLSEAAWAEMAPIIRRGQPGAATGGDES